MDETGSPHSLKEATEIYPQGNGELGALPTPQIQLFLSGELLRTYDEFPGQPEPNSASRAQSTFSSWVWPGQIFSLESHFPSQHFPFFSYWSHYCAQLSLSFHLTQLSLGKISCFPRCAQVGICSWSRLSVTESNLLNEIIYVPTLCPRQTREHYLSSLFIPEEPRLKLLSVRWSTLILRAFVCFHVSLFTTFVETDRCSN